MRPESIGIASSDSAISSSTNIFKGIIESYMYIGSIIRYTINAEDSTVYLDESDPQYRGIFKEGAPVKLILKDRIHLLPA